MNCFDPTPNTLFKTILRVLIIFFLAGLFGNPAGAGTRGPNRILKLVGPRDSVLVVDPKGRVVVSKNARKRRVPASILKIITSLTALHYMGEKYRFYTDFHVDGDKNLKVKGYGDPLLVSEVLEDIARALGGGPRPKLTRVNDIVLDGSYFERSIRIPGKTSTLEPWDAPNGALCANFNTVYFKRDAKGRFVSAEPQTPLLPSILPRIKASGLSRGRITLSHRANDNIRYFGGLLRHFLKKESVPVQGKIRTGKIKTGTDRLLYRYVSEFDLAHVVSRLLDHSNNFMANQILMAAGAHALGPPATLKKGVYAAKNFAKKSLGVPDLRIVEGSGLSRNNKVSAVEMNRALEKFAPNRHLLPWDNGQFYKTGTLNGIRTRAGYIEGPDGQWWQFVVMMNTRGKTTWRIMKRIMEMIAAGK
ncbi:MAG: hypothetical protein GY859_14110 [Desulfobacterales bacterium]|nr:hypothetical protein [Desulfobacterales bacterium]